jgi:hypothetical protein
MATSCPALELGFLCVGLLGACFFASLLFSGARSEICQLAPSYHLVMLVCWLFFNFVMSFDFGCCSLAQEMSFMDHYLPYQAAAYHLPTVSSSAFPVFVYWRFAWRSAPCISPLLSVLRAPCPLCCMFPFSSLFIIQFFFFAGHGVGLSRGICCFIPGVAVGIPCAIYLLTCWSADCLLNRFGASVWWCRSPLFS